MTVSAREKTLFALICIALPVLILASWVGILTYDRTTAETYYVIVEGYDPRDLVHGKYINFRYVWEDERSSKPEDRKVEDLPVSGKYYVPEWDAHDLETMLREDKSVFMVVMTLSKTRSQIKELLIDDQTWEEALATWREKRDNPANEQQQ